MLTFIGLGLYDEESITVEGRETLRDADRVFAEFYTSRLVGAGVADLEAAHGVEIEVRDREGVEATRRRYCRRPPTATPPFSPPATR